MCTTTNPGLVLLPLKLPINHAVDGGKEEEEGRQAREERREGAPSI